MKHKPGQSVNPCGRGTSVGGMFESVKNVYTENTSIVVIPCKAGVYESVRIGLHFTLACLLDKGVTSCHPTLPTIPLTAGVFSVLRKSLTKERP